jgi:glycosyltransferase involved in cell wall biosynthesis
MSQKVIEKHKTRILFLVWGYSIHAWRRLKIFIDDPDFEVMVVSTYHYNFDNAENILLDGLNTPLKDLDLSAGKKLGIISEFLKIGDQIATSTFQQEIMVAAHDYKILQYAVEKFKPAIIFLQTLLYPCYLAFFLPRKFKMMITFWNGDVTWWAQRSGIERYFKKQLNTYGIQTFDGITVNSQEAYNACLSYGAPQEKVQLIRYPGVDLEKFVQGDRKQSREAIEVNTSFLVFCPRGLGGYLNSDVILEAAGIVCKEYKDVKFLFMARVGDEAQWEKHLPRARELSIEKNLVRRGPVPWETMPVYYAAADVMVSISSNDSLPNCMLEAMAGKVPVIMGDIQAIKDWVPRQFDNFLCPPRDPEMLANKIIHLIEGRINNLKEFVDYNYKKVAAEANHKKNTGKVKDYVRKLATQSGKNKKIITLNEFSRQKKIRSEILYRLGQQFYRANNWEQAGKYLRKYLKTSISGTEIGKTFLSEVYFYLGEIQRLQKKGYWQYYFKKSLDLSEVREPGDALGNYQVALMYKRLKRYAPAEKEFWEIVNKASQAGLVGGAYFHLGEIEYIRKNYKKAEEIFIACTTVISGHQKAGEYLEILKTKNKKRR